MQEKYRLVIYNSSGRSLTEQQLDTLKEMTFAEEVKEIMLPANLTESGPLFLMVCKKIRGKNIVAN